MEQDKNLRVVNGFSKAAKIISMILFVLWIVLGSLCVLALLVTLALPVKDIVATSDLPSSLAEVLLELPKFSGIMAVFCVIVFGVMAFVYKMSHSYYKRELKDGTPFTEGGAKQLRTLGIIKMCASVFMSLLGSIFGNSIRSYVEKILSALNEAEGLVPGLSVSVAPGTTEGIGINFGLGMDFWLGLAFLILSFLLMHGAKLREKAELSGPVTPVGAEAEKLPESEWVPVSPYGSLK